ncbi:recombinase family protein [Streptosporangium canum]|uniref:recombinase family protein n=1 Tax=Streptosporangium canum TaxID=324952 RepID=UPI0036BE654C
MVSPHEMMGHGGHGGMSMAAMVADMRNRFLVALVFSIPIVAWSPIGTEVLGLDLPVPFGLRQDVWALLLSLPVIFYSTPSRAQASPGSSPRRSPPAPRAVPNSTGPSPWPANCAPRASRSPSWSRLGRGIELAALAEQLKAGDIGLQFLTGDLRGSHDPSGIVFTVLAALSGMEREYIRDRTLEGHESARTRGKTIGGAAVTDDAMLSMALHLRDQNLSLREIASRLVITTDKKKGQHPSPATIWRMLRDHDEATAPSASS